MTIATIPVNGTDVEIDPSRAKALAGIQTRFVPKGNRVLVKAEDADRTESGLYLAGNATHEQRIGKVYDVGGSYPVGGTWASPVCAQGDRIMFNVTGAGKITIKGEQYFVVRNEDVVGVYVDE